MRAVRMILATAGAATLVAVALPAHAVSSDEQSCTVSISIPSKLVIKSWNSLVTAKLIDPSSCAEYASWSLAKGTEDSTSSATFSQPNAVDRISFYTGPSGNHSGTYRALGSHAYSDDTFLDDDGYSASVTVVQTDSTPMVAKYASKLAWVTVARTAGQTTLKARALRYTPFASFGGYVKWKHARVLVQKRVNGTWRTLKTVRTDAKGVAVAHISGARGTWRLATVDSSSVWGAATDLKHG